MRTFTLLTISLVFSLSALAQIEKGSLFLGGSFLVHSDKYENQISQVSKNTGYGARLELGKAMAENRIAGVFISFSYNSTKNSNGASTSKISNPGFGVELFKRNYYRIANNWFLFGQGDLEIVRYTATYRLDGVVNQKKNSWSLSAGISPGITFAAKKGLYVETTLSRLLAVSYSFGRNRDYNPSGTVVAENRETHFSANGNLSGWNNLAIGLRWIIPQSRKS